jgi:hypothetical protein
VRWRLGDSSGEVPERVSGAEDAYHYEGQAAGQQHPPAQFAHLRSTSTIWPCAGKGQWCRVAIPSQSRCRASGGGLGATDHVSGFRTAGRFGPWPEWTAGVGPRERYLRPTAPTPPRGWSVGSARLKRDPLLADILSMSQTMTHGSKRCVYCGERRLSLSMSEGIRGRPFRISGTESGGVAVTHRRATSRATAETSSEAAPGHEGAVRSRSHFGPR